MVLTFAVGTGLGASDAWDLLREKREGSLCAEVSWFEPFIVYERPLLTASTVGLFESGFYPGMHYILGSWFVVTQ
jgi:hypothetical protein